MLFRRILHQLRCALVQWSALRLTCAFSPSSLDLPHMCSAARWWPESCDRWLCCSSHTWTQSTQRSDILFKQPPLHRHDGCNTDCISECLFAKYSNTCALQWKRSDFVNVIHFFFFLSFKTSWHQEEHGWLNLVKIFLTTSKTSVLVFSNQHGGWI